MSMAVIYRRRDFCPVCGHAFEWRREDLETECPKCLTRCRVVLDQDQDGDCSYLEKVEEIKPLIIAPPTGTVEAVMRAVEHSMHAQIGIPAHLMDDPLAQRVLTLEETLRFIQQTTIQERFTTVLEECRSHLSVRDQAEIMGMRIENNRKRMRKRMRQRRRRWSWMDEHWTNNPNGDW